MRGAWCVVRGASCVVRGASYRVIIKISVCADYTVLCMEKYCILYRYIVPYF